MQEAEQGKWRDGSADGEARRVRRLEERQYSNKCRIELKTKRTDGHHVDQRFEDCCCVRDVL